MVSIGTLFAFCLVCVGIIVMRKKMPDAERKFKVPFVPLIPVLGVVVCVYLMTSLTKESWYRLIVWLIIGIIIYFFYGKKHSKVED